MPISKIFREILVTEHDGRAVQFAHRPHIFGTTDRKWAAAVRWATKAPSASRCRSALVRPLHGGELGLKGIDFQGAYETWDGTTRIVRSELLPERSMTNDEDGQVRRMPGTFMTADEIH